jgi:D-psicose/D-tagatose/L-ribulose 3-epimerase
MYRTGVHAFVWTADWTETSCRYAIEMTKRAGYDYIEIPLFDPSAVDAEMTARVLEEYELGVTCSLGLPFDADISSPDEEVSTRGHNLLGDVLSVARDLGAKYVGGVIYSALGKYVVPASPKGRAHCVAALGGLAEVAARSGISLGLEPVNRYESNLINTLAEASRLIADVGAPNIVVHPDTYHMNIEELDPGDAIRDCAGRIGYVHVGENNRGYLGSGGIDFASTFRALADIGYDGIVTFEAFSTAVMSDEMAAALAIWRSTWDDSLDLATRARSFIEDQSATAAAGGRSAS